MVSKWCCTIKTDIRSVSIHVLPSFRNLCQHTPVLPVLRVHQSQHTISHEVMDDSCTPLTQRRERCHKYVQTHFVSHTDNCPPSSVPCTLQGFGAAHTPLSPQTGDTHMSPDLNSQPLHVLLTPELHICLINFIWSWRWIHCVIWFQSGAFVFLFCGRGLGVGVCPGVEGPSCCWGVTAGISQSL